MRLFFDTSSFMKRYIAEVGSDQVEALCASAEDVAISIVLPIEGMATISRLKREKKITGHDYQHIKKELAADLKDITIIPFSALTVRRAVQCIEIASSKAMDAVHIASALEWKPDFFVSSDRQQLTAATVSGLKIKPVL